MTEHERQDVSGSHETPDEVLHKIDRRLEAGRSQGDAERLETLEEIHRTLESDLERDLDQAGSPRS